jgi:hypothetical protein
VAILIVLFTTAARAGDPEASYTFTLSIDPATGTVTGEGEIAFTNSSTQPLAALPLLLYPNRFRTVDPHINDVNRERYYSYRFHEGDILLSRVTGAGGLPLDVAALEGMPEGTYAQVKLGAPLAPYGTVRIGVRFETHVPDRFGLFGRRGDRLVAEGGLWPMVPARDASGAFVPAFGPILARHRITARTTSGTVFVQPTRDARTVFIGAGEDMVSAYHLDAQPALNAPSIDVIGAKGDDDLERIAWIAKRAAQVFRRNWIEADLDPITLVVAPVRDRLAQAAGDVVFVSDHIFEVLPYFDAFHEREITRAVFELLARRAAVGVEGPDTAWVAEAVAWVAIEDWDRARLGLKGTELRQGIGNFDFIEGVDTQLRAPQFTDSDLYFGRVFEPRNTVKDEIDRFGSSRPRGRVIAEKLRDRLGSAKLLALVKGRGLPFRQRAAKLAGEDLKGFFDLWLGAPPRENLKITDEHGTTLQDGKEGIAVTVRRDTDDPRLAKVGEPVQVQVDSGDQRERATWDGKGDEGTIIVPRHGYFYSVDVDPENRIEETDKGDDLWPSIGKLLLNRFDFNIDLNGGNTESVDAGFTFHPQRDYHQSVLIDAFYTPTAQGGRVGYAYLFGHELTEIQFAQSVFAFATFEHVEPGLLRFAANELTESDGTLCAYTIGYALDTHEAAIRPTYGGHFGVALEAAYGPCLGGDFTYQKASANLSWLFTPFEPLTFAFLAQGGQVIGSNPPTQVYFDAGGEGGVRGVRTGDFVDRAGFVLKGEIRLTVLEDLDLGVLRLFWLRRIELAGFSDAGDVKYDFGTIFRAPGQWKWGSGAGIRAQIDIAGIRPILLRFDVAWRCDSGIGPDKGVPQFYFGVDEPF